MPGIAEAIRAAGVGNDIPTAMLSRGVAGVIGSCLVVNLPGSRGGVKDGLAVLAPVLRTRWSRSSAATIDPGEARCAAGPRRLTHGTVAVRPLEVGRRRRLARGPQPQR